MLFNDKILFTYCEENVYSNSYRAFLKQVLNRIDDPWDDEDIHYSMASVLDSSNDYIWMLFKERVSNPLALTKDVINNVIEDAIEDIYELIGRYHVYGQTHTR